MVVSPPIILLGVSMIVAVEALLVSSFVPAEPITAALECFVFDDVRPRCSVPAPSLLFLSVFVTGVDKSVSISISAPSPFNSIFIFPSIVVSIVVLPVLVLVVVVLPVLVAAPTMFDVAESSFIIKFDRHSR